MAGRAPTALESQAFAVADGFKAVTELSALPPGFTATLIAFRLGAESLDVELTDVPDSVVESLVITTWELSGEGEPREALKHRMELIGAVRDSLAGMHEIEVVGALQNELTGFAARVPTIDRGLALGDGPDPETVALAERCEALMTERGDDSRELREAALAEVERARSYEQRMAGSGAPRPGARDRVAQLEELAAELPAPPARGGRKARAHQKDLETRLSMLLNLHGYASLDAYQRRHAAPEPADDDSLGSAARGVREAEAALARVIDGNHPRMVEVESRCAAALAALRDRLDDRTSTDENLVERAKEWTGTNAARALVAGLAATGEVPDSDDPFGELLSAGSAAKLLEEREAQLRHRLEQAEEKVSAAMRSPGWDRTDLTTVPDAIILWRVEMRLRETPHAELVIDGMPTDRAVALQDCDRGASSTSLVVICPPG